MSSASVKNVVGKVTGLACRRPVWAVLMVAGLGGGWMLLTPHHESSRRAAEEVLASVRTWPDDRGNIIGTASRRVCKRVKSEIFVSGLGMMNNVDQPRMALPAPGYDAGVTGVYFGGGPSGIASGAFLQALMDVGVVRRVPVTIVTHTHAPSEAALAFVPLQDTMAGGMPVAPPQQFTDSNDQMKADLFIGTGGAADWFIANPSLRTGLMGIAPAMTPRPVPVKDGTGKGVVPPGIVAPDGLCYPLEADHVLEYTDVRSIGYKKREITVAILMKPREMPHWVSDPRIFEALLDGPVLPEDVHVWTFQDAGDGWRLAGITDMREMAGKGHYVGD